MSILVQNVTTNRYFDVSLCKRSLPLMTECDIGPGEEAVLMPFTNLWFVLISEWACVHPPKQGDVLNSLDAFGVKVKVDLHACQWRGTRIVLKYDKEEDEYSLSNIPVQ